MQLLEHIKLTVVDSEALRYNSHLLSLLVLYLYSSTEEQKKDLHFSPLLWTDTHKTINFSVNRKSHVLWNHTHAVSNPFLLLYYLGGSYSVLYVWYSWLHVPQQC